MNDLMTRMLFGTVIAKNRGLSQSEAFKVGLLTGMDNSKNSFMPVVSAKMMADDKIALEKANNELAECKAKLEGTEKDKIALENELAECKAKLAKAENDLTVCQATTGSVNTPPPPPVTPTGSVNTPPPPVTPTGSVNTPPPVTPTTPVKSGK